MPQIAYDYRTLNNIGWPAPGAAVGPGITTCAAAPTNLLPGAAMLQNPTAVALLNAALATGLYPGPQALNNFEMAWRMNALLSAADLFGVNLTSTAVFNHADPTEKANLSYHLGSTLTAWLASAVGIFVAPVVGNFMHLSRVLAINPAAVAFGGPLRPDFVSAFFPGGTFQIWEAKGRTGGGVPQPLRDGFRQTQDVQQVLGVVPNGFVVVLGRQAGGFWRVHVTDPSSASDSSPTPTEQANLFLEYYRPWKTLLEAEQSQAEEVTFAGATFTVVPFASPPMLIGLDQRIILLLNQYRADSISAGELAGAIEKVIVARYSSPSTETQFVNPNGLYTQFPLNFAPAG